MQVVKAMIGIYSKARQRTGGGMQMRQGQQGFSLIELVIVVIILGLLAVTALPRFLDVTDEAKAANVEGMAGGYATGVALARAQWESQGRPTQAGVNTVWYDGTQLFLTSENRSSATPVSPGYPVDNANRDGASNSETMSGARCVAVWNGILQNPPAITASEGAADLAAARYFTNAVGGNCGYWLVDSLQRTNDGRDYASPGTDTSIGNNFVYDPKTGRVAININNGN